jgi:hypothetical protein
MVTSEQERQVARVLHEEQKGIDGPAEVELHDDRTRETRFPNFSRMRVDWSSSEAAAVRGLGETITVRLMEKFGDLYELLNDFHTIVRTPMVDDHGEILCDRFNMPVWEKTAAGNYLEDWTQLRDRDMRDFLFSITTRVVDWEQRSQECWLEAMVAKVNWEEQFTSGYLDTGGRTVEDRTQNGRSAAMQDRYFAIFQASYSRRAEALVDDMKLLALRISQRTLTD